MKMEIEKYKLSPLREYEYLPLTKNSGVNYAKEVAAFKVIL